ncbi:MAG: sulfur carrier protein [Francisellaceae bacterium]|jgi:sulfur carrier protein
MNVLFNGKNIEIKENKSLLDLLNDLDINTQYTAVSVNNVLVQKIRHPEFIPNKNDVIEILTPMQGG